jgi:hypothetical protein
LPPGKKIKNFAPLKTFTQICAFLASAFCLLGGLWILSRTTFSSKDDILSTAIGFYFIGKAFFVGPMLWVAAKKFNAKIIG